MKKNTPKMVNALQKIRFEGEFDLSIKKKQATFIHIFFIFRKS